MIHEANYIGSLISLIKKKWEIVSSVLKLEKSKEEETTMADAKKVYHVAKREDGKWQIKLTGGEKAIKLFNTKAEAEEYAKKLGSNQEGTVLIHASKGASKGKITGSQKHGK